MYFIEPWRTLKKKLASKKCLVFISINLPAIYSNIGKYMKTMSVCPLYWGNGGRMWNMTKKVNGRTPGLSPSWTYNALFPAHFAVKRGLQQPEEGNASVSEVRQSQHAKLHFLFWLGPRAPYWFYKVTHLNSENKWRQLFWTWDEDYCDKKSCQWEIDQSFM